MCSYKMKLTNHEWDVIDACVSYKIWKNCIIPSIILISGVLSTIDSTGYSMSNLVFQVYDK